LPQDGRLVLLPKMIDFKGFRVHAASPTQCYRDSAGRLPYSMLGIIKYRNLVYGYRKFKTIWVMAGNERAARQAFGSSKASWG
jgi:hypothetical protein